MYRILAFWKSNANSKMSMHWIEIRLAEDFMLTNVGALIEYWLACCLNLHGGAHQRLLLCARFQRCTSRTWSCWPNHVVASIFCYVSMRTRSHVRTHTTPWCGWWCCTIMLFRMLKFFWFCLQEEQNCTALQGQVDKLKTQVCVVPVIAFWYFRLEVIPSFKFAVEIEEFSCRRNGARHNL